MTADELYLWKLNVRVCLLEQLAMQILKREANVQTDPKQWLENWAKTTEDRFAKLSFSTNEAVQSDMLAAEAQECVRVFVSLLFSAE